MKFFYDAKHIVSFSVLSAVCCLSEMLVSNP